MKDPEFIPGPASTSPSSSPTASDPKLVNFVAERIWRDEWYGGDSPQGLTSPEPRGTHRSLAKLAIAAVDEWRAIHSETPA